MEFDKSKSAGYLTNHLARLFASELQNAIRHLGIAPAQFMTMLELWREDGQTQKTLVQKLHVEQATMANTLTRMERDGLIRRKPNPADARSQQIWLTQKAKKLEGPATDAAGSINDIALADLSETEKAQFLDLMGRVIATLQPETGNA
ncbi:MarR family transcriptional regulator [Hoeflea sp. WL0058]|uniref:MarR family transcriptional regulator n=1 Tax=Flavimaribacter sediminis TaxID=2865987 RepID=A0AAE2ZKN0_9HYPH|nr:MarR family transcriptional regulator [Flavimaribacter sediminis]MBW8637754.1 MarR family transcriptional regulator [Flavimaribacter sediminis]